MTEPVIFKSNYFLRTLTRDLHPFTPNVLVIDEEHIEFRRKNFHLVSEDTETLHFKNITGVTVDSHLFGSTITIKSTGNDPIHVHGFWKKEANEIKALCAKYINAYNNRSTPGSSSPVFSIADELTKLKSLLDQGVITAEEFEKQKQKLLQ
ncbi:SHOCT domain-containing protein [Antarcticibacterium flavum]|uniref:SHOCT domain-containing protein n=1 Tax=Antarcticibacterium flavum TaxID=2058175 RepID=A0A5B7X976_9FLAO|nr:MULTISPECIES: SHOCT domain-containing protein [Antarcticibacterium]MCM4160693.1 hypothetical protein [Antarcticibacterium sp. W02-3]QCY71161.1 SHOCT domain-containing protein [Antarcticibacterium flavum]